MAESESLGNARSWQPPATETPLPMVSWPRQLAWGFIGVIFFILSLSVFVPWTTRFPASDLDGSWTRVLHWAHICGADFGREIVFTYGPWGFLSAGYVKETFGLVVLGWSLCGAAFFAGSWTLARRMTDRAGVAAIWMAVVIGIAGSSRMQIEDVRVFALSWLLLVVHFYVPNSRQVKAVKVLLVVAMALGSLIKFSMLLTAVVVLIAILFDDLRRRRMPWQVLVFAAAFLGFWVGAGQKVGSLRLYLEHSWWISTGYAQGQEVTQPTEARDVMLFLLCALLIPVAALICREPKGRALVAAALAGALLVVWKSGYVRHDLHEITATTALALLSLLCLSVMFSRMGNRIGNVIVVASVVSAWSLAWHSDRQLPAKGLGGYLMEVVTEFPARASTAAGWISGNDELQRDSESQIGQLRTDMLPPVRGSVDIYSWDQRLVVAKKLDYRPRPVFQSYLAYSQELADLNAEFLRSDRAPDTILFDQRPLDQQYPSQVDGVSWPELLTRYDLKDARYQWLVLERAAQPRQYSFAPLGETVARMGEWIDVPRSADPIWVSLSPKMTLLGKALGAAYKPPRLEIGIRGGPGDGTFYRLLPDLAKRGFLLSPLVPHQMSFAMLSSDRWAELAPSVLVTNMSLRVNTDAGPAAAYEDEYTVRFSALQYPHFDLSNVPGISEYFRVRELVARLKNVYSDEPPRILAIGPGQYVVLAPAASDLLISAPPSAKSVHLGFGMLDESFTGKEKTDGVEFQAYAISQINGTSFKGSQIWSRTLHPADVRQDRGPQEEDVILRAAAPGGILLKCMAGPLHKASYSYWSDVEFR